LWKSGEAERGSGISLKLFGFIAEPVFTFIPESCSRLSRNTVRNHPGIAFILPRNPHYMPGEQISNLESRYIAHSRIGGVSNNRS
jgi:hypothetical protein